MAAKAGAIFDDLFDGETVKMAQSFFMTAVGHKTGIVVFVLIVAGHDGVEIGLDFE